MSTPRSGRSMSVSTLVLKSSAGVSRTTSVKVPPISAARRGFRDVLDMNDGSGPNRPKLHPRGECWEVKHFGRLIDLFDRRLDRLAHLSYLFGATDEYRSDTHLSRALEDRQFQPRGRTPAYHAVDSQRANQGAG